MRPHAALAGAIALGGTIIWSTSGFAQTTPCQGSTGPDVIVGDIAGPANYTATGGIDALSLGTTSCNMGTVNLNWIAGNNQHPVIGGNLYKYHSVNGATRFEQLGMSWLKHGFFALSQFLCCPNCQATGGSQLGVGCSDPYTASRNGDQGNLGPRWQVNANTGFFIYPPAQGTGIVGNARRLEVSLAELQVSNGSTVRYFGEAQYVSPDDAAANNNDNNASYRELLVTGGPTNYNFSLTGATQREKAAIRAWQAIDPGVVLVNVFVPSEGHFIVGYKVTNLGNGLWNYEYAIYNMNSDRSGGSFSLPIPGCVDVTNIGFHDVQYRNGDGISNVTFSSLDWAGIRSATDLTWSSEPFSTTPNGNAIRWGTTYNFRFVANAPPTGRNATLGLFKPGSPASMSVAVVGPEGEDPPVCPADIAPKGGDGVVNVDDLLAVIGSWGVPNGVGDVSPPCGDGVVDVNDLLAVVGTWGPCPN